MKKKFIFSKPQDNMNYAHSQFESRGPIQKSTRKPVIETVTPSSYLNLREHTNRDMILSDYLNSTISCTAEISLNPEEIEQLVNEQVSESIYISSDSLSDLDNQLDLLRGYYYDFKIRTITQMSQDFLNYAVSLSIRDYLQNVSDTGFLNVGLPYLGPGFDKFKSLLDSTNYNVSTVSNFRPFLNYVLTRRKFANLTFLGMGDGEEIIATLDVMDSLDSSLVEGLKSINMVDTTLKGMIEVYKKVVDYDTDKKLLNCTVAGNVGSFEDMRLYNDFSNNIFDLVVLIGLTSSNVNFETLIDILDNFTSVDSNVLMDLGIGDLTQFILIIESIVDDAFSFDVDSDFDFIDKVESSVLTDTEKSLILDYIKIYLNNNEKFELFLNRFNYLLNSLDFDSIFKLKEMSILLSRYTGKSNMDFLTHNFSVILKSLGVSDTSILEMKSSFEVFFVPEDDYPDFVSIESSVRISDEINHVVNQSFGFRLPEKVVLMNSYRRPEDSVISELKKRGFRIKECSLFDETSVLFTLLSKES